MKFSSKLLQRIGRQLPWKLTVNVLGFALQSGTAFSQTFPPSPLFPPFPIIPGGGSGGGSGGGTASGQLQLSLQPSTSSVDPGGIDALVSATPATRYLNVSNTSSSSADYTVTHNPNASDSSPYVTQLYPSGTMFPSSVSGSVNGASNGFSGMTLVGLQSDVSQSSTSTSSFGLTTSSGLTVTGSPLYITTRVYDLPSPVANNNATIDVPDAGATLSVTNDHYSTMQANIRVFGPGIDSGDFTATGFATSTLTPGSTATSTVQFNSANTLNGTYTGTARASLGIDYYQINTFSTYFPGDITWSLSHTVTGNTGDGQAEISQGSSYAGFSAQQRDSSGNLVKAQLLAGTAGNNRTVSLAFTKISFDTRPSATDLAVNVTGTEASPSDTDAFVLQLDFEGSVSGSPILLWKNPAGLFVNAVDGNIGKPGSQAGYYNESFDTYLAGTHFDPDRDLGAYGTYADLSGYHAWAAIDHNSLFTVGDAETSTPEPTALATLACLSLAALRRRRS